MIEINQNTLIACMGSTGTFASCRFRPNRSHSLDPKHPDILATLLASPLYCLGGGREKHDF